MKSFLQSHLIDRLVLEPRDDAQSKQCITGKYEWRLHLYESIGMSVSFK